MAAKVEPRQVHGVVESEASATTNDDKATGPAVAEPDKDSFAPSVPTADSEPVTVNIPKTIISVASANRIYAHLNESQRLMRIKTLQIIQNSGFVACDTPSLNTLADFGLNVATTVLSRSELRASVAKRPRLLKLQDVTATLCMPSSPVKLRELLKYMRWRKKQSSLYSFLNALPSIRARAPPLDAESGSTNRKRNVTFALPLTSSEPSVLLNEQVLAGPRALTASTGTLNDQAKSILQRPRTVQRAIVPLEGVNKVLSSQQLKPNPEWPLDRRPEWLEPQLGYPAPPPGFEYLLTKSLSGLDIDNADASPQKHSDNPSSFSDENQKVSATDNAAEIRMDIDLPSASRTAAGNAASSSVTRSTVNDLVVAQPPATVKKPPVASDGIPSFIPRDPVTGKPQWDLAFLVTTAPQDTSPFIPPKLAVIKPPYVDRTIPDETRMKSHRHRAKDADYDNDHEKTRRREERRRERKLEQRQNRSISPDRRPSSDKQERHREKDRHRRRKDESSKRDRHHRRRRSPDDEEGQILSPLTPGTRPTTRTSSATGGTRSNAADVRSPATPATLESTESSSTTTISSKSSHSKKQADFMPSQKKYGETASPAVPSQLSPNAAEQQKAKKLTNMQAKVDADNLTADEESETRTQMVRTPPEPIKITISRPSVVKESGVADSSPVGSMKLKKKKKNKRHRRERLSPATSPESPESSFSPDIADQRKSYAKQNVFSPPSGRLSDSPPVDSAAANRELSAGTRSNFEISDTSAPDVLQDELLRIKQNILKDLQKASPPADGQREEDELEEGEIEEPEVVVSDKKKKKKKRKHAKRDKRSSRNENVDDSSPTTSPEQPKNSNADENERPLPAVSSLVVRNAADRTSHLPSSSESESIIDPYVPATATKAAVGRKGRKGGKKQRKKDAADEEQGDNENETSPVSSPAVAALPAKIPSLKIKLPTNNPPPAAADVALPSPATDAEEENDDAFSPVAPETAAARRLAAERESPLSPDEENEQGANEPVEKHIVQSKPQSDNEDDAEADAVKARKKKEKKKKKKKEKKHRKDADRTPPKPNEIDDEVKQPSPYVAQTIPPPAQPVVNSVTVAATEPKKPLKLLLKLSKQTEQPKQEEIAVPPPPPPVEIPTAPHKKDKKKKKRARSPSSTRDAGSEAEQGADEPEATTVAVPTVSVKSPPVADRDEEVDEISTSKSSTKLRKKPKTSTHKRSVTEEHERSQAVDLPLESSTTMRLTVKDTPALSAVTSPIESAVPSPSAAPAPAPAQPKKTITKEKSMTSSPPKNLEKVTGEVQRELDPDKWYEWPPPPDAVNDPEKYGYPLEWLVEYTEDGQYWQCPACTWKDNGRLPMVGCDGPCAAWYHYPCVGLRKEPTQAKWYCPNCRAEPNKSWLLKPKEKKRPAGNDGGKSGAAKKRKR